VTAESREGGAEHRRRYLSSVHCGETLRCSGIGKNGHRFGIQLILRTYEVTLPAYLRGIQQYQASGLIRGIGAHSSERMVSWLGEDTLVIMDRTPERLPFIEGICLRCLPRIVEGSKEQRALREVMTCLLGHGVSQTFVLKMFRTHVEDSIADLQANPFPLAMVGGIGFRTADVMVRHIGIRKDADERIDEGNAYCLYELSNDGHLISPGHLSGHRPPSVGM
jgi:exodeoxyribonuclease V alpha subunit